MEQDNIVDELFNKIISLLIKDNITGSCLLGSILLHEALNKRGISSKLQEGFYITNNMFYGYHIWLIVNNKNYDIGLTVNNIVYKNMFKENGITNTITIDEPKNLERIDLDNKQEKSEYLEMKRMYTNYSKNPRIYWKTINKKYLRSWENRK